jgi:hypothetical protein
MYKEGEREDRRREEGGEGKEKGERGKENGEGKRCGLTSMTYRIHL